MALRMTGAPDEPELVDLPWSLPLRNWPADQLVGLPRGISRHVVRFVRLHDAVYAVKEIGAFAAYREYAVLRRLARLDVPAVEVVGIVDGRLSATGEELEPALVTRHLEFSLPYRALYSRTLRPETAVRLLDALAVLLVRLHLAGFYWGDCSLSNTLFRRDAGSFAAYLVDAETTEHHEVLSDGQRSYDLSMARTNIIGELMDLQAGELLDEQVDPIDIGDTIASRYRELWQALTEPEVFGVGERHRVEARVRRLNALGFDVAELDVSTDLAGGEVRIQPKVVDAGHHARRLLRLTGLDVEENQARRLLNDLDAFRAADPRARLNESEQIAAHRWLTEVFHPVVQSVPRELHGKLEQAEVFHEVLEHRWFLSEQAGRDVGTAEAATRYVEHVLRHKPDEKAVLAPVPRP
ncbi:MAG: hypothetical protein JWN77_2275 [Frankiales bacterium]|jgi:hypothetical protein|nr:hypothetical protein [Frankiales bacterium]